MTACTGIFDTIPLSSTNVRPPAPTKLVLLDGGGKEKSYKNKIFYYALSFSLSLIRKTFIGKNTFCKALKLCVTVQSGRSMVCWKYCKIKTPHFKVHKMLVCLFTYLSDIVLYSFFCFVVIL